MTRALLVAAALVVPVLVAGFWWMGQGDRPAELAEVVVPELSPRAEAGKRLFDGNCARCHGANAAGSENGPPLIHGLYEPNHHADFAFQRAVRQGVTPHHWNFGPMPPVEGVSDAGIVRIVAYVREMQRANGIR